MQKLNNHSGFPKFTKDPKYMDFRKVISDHRSAQDAIELRARNLEKQRRHTAIKQWKESHNLRSLVANTTCKTSIIAFLNQLDQSWTILNMHPVNTGEYIAKNPIFWPPYKKQQKKPKPLVNFWPKGEEILGPNPLLNA